MRIIKTISILIVLAILIGLLFQVSYPSKIEHIIYPLEYRKSIKAASVKYSIDPYLICAIIYVESKFNPSSESSKGAVGLMQVMPDTGKWIAKTTGQQFDVNDLDDPEKNIDMGCWYFNYLRSKYQDERLVLAAYNSGYKNVDTWLRTANHDTVDDLITRIPYSETRLFVQRVQKARSMYKKIYPKEFDAIGLQ